MLIYLKALFFRIRAEEIFHFGRRWGLSGVFKDVDSSL
uniref:Uncharacterized protein n=1 Tax=Rhizophora mucronata TaxID=61149 RepID=A0A2P2QC77_RHIMU